MMGGGILFSVLVFIIIALMLTCVAAIIMNLAKPNKFDADDLPPCEPVDFCTKDEQAFYVDLNKIAEKMGVLIFSKVGLGCVLKPRRGVAERELWSQQLRGEYADFILCDPSTLRALIVVMLDDSTLALQKTRVTMVDKACEQAGVPIIHVREYNLPGLEKAILQKIGNKRMARTAKEQDQEEQTA